MHYYLNTEYFWSDSCLAWMKQDPTCPRCIPMKGQPATATAK